jgi:glycolate oxidase FAD binding subunit
VSFGTHLEALREELGAGVLELHEEQWLDGVALRGTLRPVDGEALAGVLAALSAAGLAAVPRGGGTHLGLGNPPTRADLWLSTERLAGVDEFEPGEGVCHALAGTTVAEVARVVGDHGWQLPLDVHDPHATVGGALAAAVIGPRSHGLGLVRDAVLGLEVALASGERTRCGGRVVKNVTGYDLAKLYCGSLGTLGVIEGAWLRLRPAPERALVLAAQLSPLESACARVLQASRRSSVRACGLVGDDAGALRCVIELAGDAVSLSRDADWLGAELGAGEVGGDALDALRRRQHSLPGEGGLRLRLGVLPSELARVLEGLLEAGADVLAYPGLHLVWARFAAGDPAAAEGSLAAVSALAGPDSGGVVCEAAPLALKRAHDMFGESASLLPLLRALKTRFDPDGVLSPGRFAGRL